MTVTTYVFGIVSAAVVLFVVFEMLRRRREGDDDELVRRCIQLAINGVATALRNSG